ncbi:MAG: hypothetical protein B7X57_08655 [Erythrobacter sp. 34-65-8]|nr:MAG: hypothetical protein B7X57_08655 [Erythrobacter sp. 34-65-8]
MRLSYAVRVARRLDEMFIPTEHIPLALGAVLLGAKKMLVKQIEQHGLGSWITELHEEIAREFKNAESEGARAYDLQHVHVMLQTIDDLFREILRQYPNGESLLREDCRVS